MKKEIVVVAVLLGGMVTNAAAQPPDNVRIYGNITIKSGGAITFPDGSMQYTAAPTQGPAGPANSLSIGTVTTGDPGSSAAATITGSAPSQTLNLTLPQGPAGTCSSIKYQLKRQSTLTINTGGYASVRNLHIKHDTTGKSTGWTQDSFSGSYNGTAATTTPSAWISYNSAYDIHNNPTSGYIYQTPFGQIPKGAWTFTASYTYDSSGNRTQRVRTMTNISDNSTYRVQTTNYAPHLAMINETFTTYNNGVPTTTTDTYSGTKYDENGYPTTSNVTTTNSEGVTLSTGVMTYEYEPRCYN